MKFSVASVLALATAAFAAPAAELEERTSRECTYYVGATELDVVVAAQIYVGVKANVDVLGLLDVKAALTAEACLALFLKIQPTCKKVYCCPTTCTPGQHIPSTCYLAH